MGCRDGWQQTGILVKVAFFIVGVSMFCNWLAFCTTAWIRDSTTSTSSGLWRTSVLQLDGTYDVKIGVTQAFACVGFMSQNVGFLLIVLYMFKGNCRGNSEVRLASAGLLIISMVGWLISVAIAGADADDKGIVDNLHYSYALAVVACGLGLIGGIFMIVGGRGQGHGSVGHK